MTKTVKAILTKTKSFHQVGADPEPGSHYYGAGRTICADPNQGLPQDLPEWVKETNTWRFGVQDGSIREVK